MSLPVILSKTALLTFDAIAVQVLQRLGNKAYQDFKKKILFFWDNRQEPMI
jgi:hypothetical protein